MSRVLVITGGSSGIGRATALLFAERGYRVYALSRRGAFVDDALVNDSAENVSSLSNASSLDASSLSNITHLPCDVSDPAACQCCIDQVIEREGHLDLLISNAGMGISGPAEFATTADAHRLFDVNFFGAVHIIQAVLPHMRAQRQGRILVVTSVAALFGIPYQSFYSASKAALNLFVQSLRNEVAAHGIEVGCLLPGDVQTGFTAAREKSIVGADVYPHAQRSVASMEHDERHGMTPQHVAHRLWRLSHTRHLSLYNIVGWQYRLLAHLAPFVPDSLITWVLGKMY